MQCYLDKSTGRDDTGDEWLTLVGVMARGNKWREFNAQWNAMLWGRYPIAPKIHMTDIIYGKDPFERVVGWDKGKKQELVLDALNLIQELDKKMFMTIRCSINISGRKRVISEGHKVADPIDICVEYVTGNALMWHSEGEPMLAAVSFTFDQGEEFFTPLLRRWTNVKTPNGAMTTDPDSNPWDIIKEVREEDSRYCYALQFADLLAWSHTRSLQGYPSAYRLVNEVVRQVVPTKWVDIGEREMRDVSSRRSRQE